MRKTDRPPLVSLLRNTFPGNYASLVKAGNFIHRRLAYGIGMLFTRAAPTSSRSVILYVDLSDGCNLNCVMCATKHKEIGKQQVFNIDFFDNKIGPLFKHADDFQIGCLYEPLLAPNLKEIFVSIARNLATGVRGSLVSNGTLLNARNITILLESGIFKRLRFSVDAASQQLYESIRIGAKYNLFIKNISELIKYRNSIDRSVSIEFNFTLMPENIEELPLLIELAGNLGVDVVTTHKLHPNDMGPIDDDYYSLISDYVCQAQEVADKNKVKYIANNYYTQAMFNETAKLWQAQKRSTLCSLKDGPALLRIDPSADVFTPCLRVPVRILNMSANTIDKIFEKKSFSYLLKCYQKSSSICFKCYMYQGNNRS